MFTQRLAVEIVIGVAAAATFALSTIIAAGV